jgi:GNAT superfamily N-acetyltransferase
MDLDQSAPPIDQEVTSAPTSVAKPRFYIKKATAKDFETVFRFVGEMVAASVFDFAKPSRRKIRELFLYPKTGTFIAFKDDEPIGFVSAVIDAFFFSDYERATDLGFYIRPGHRGGSTALRLLRTIEKWAKAMGAKELFMGHSVGGKVDEMKSFYIRNGYRVGGFNSMKVL